MEDNILIFGHKNPDTDSICSSIVEKILSKKRGINNVKAVRLGNINKETQFALDYLGIEAPELIEKVEDGQKVILVDHNEAAQSVENRENAEIIAVIDHHRISDFNTAKPLYYTAKPFGCTSTILYEEFKELNIEIEKKEAILMLSAIISDTLLLKSPGTDTSALSAKEIIDLDAKEFDEKGKKIIVAQVNTADINDVFSRKEDLSFAMEKEIADKNLNLCILVITDIINTNSRIIALGKDKELVEKAFNQKLDVDDSMLLEGVVSRKKQIAPPLLAVL